jgi:hypothetical protein
VEGDDSAVAAAVDGRWFFLPFFTTKRDGRELPAALTLATEAILDFKTRNEIVFPPWVSEIRFQRENELSAAIAEAEQTLLRVNEEGRQWQKYKAILCTSGERLVGIVVEIFRNYFGLNVSYDEKYVEDALIKADDNSPLYVVEVKGVKGGIKRENINQLDNHRERLGISSDVPGLLILNDFLNVDSFEERKAKHVDNEMLAHARKLNVRVLRTTALIELMLRCEKQPDRKQAFLQTCAKADPLVLLD